MTRILKRLIVRNFRLFGDKERIFDFGGGFTEFIAGNYKGKSTLYYAIKIGLTGKIPSGMRRLGDQGAIHFPQLDDKNKAKKAQEKLNAEINIVLNNEPGENGRIFYEFDPSSDEIIIETTIPPRGKIKCYVNGIEWEKNNIRTVLKRLGINPENPLLFLEQGKATTLLSKGPIGLMESFEETLDSKETKENLDDALNSYLNTEEQYKNTRTRFYELERTLNKYEKEYERFKKFLDLNSELKRTQIEKLVKILNDTIISLESDKNDLTSIEDNNKEIYTENENLIKDLNKIRIEIAKYQNEKKVIEELKEKYQIELGQIRLKIDNYPEKLNKIDSILNEINKLRQLNIIELNNRLSILKETLSKSNYENEGIKNNISKIRTELKELKKGGLIGPSNSEKFLKILKQNEIKADLLINTLNIEPIPSDNIEKIKKLQYFESVLGTLRWSIVIYDFKDEFAKAVKIAKECFFNNYLIKINEGNNNLQKYSIVFDIINLNSKSLLIKKYIEKVIDEFEKKILKIEDYRLIKDMFGTRFFILKPGEFYLNKSERVKWLEKQEGVLTKNKKEMTKKIEQMEQEILEINEINEKIEKEEQLILEKEKLISEYKKNKARDIKIKKELEKNKNEIKNFEEMIEESRKKEYDINYKLENNQRILDNNNIKISDLRNQNNKLEIIIKNYNKFLRNVKENFKRPREISILNYIINEINENLKKLSNIDFEIKEKYFKTKGSYDDVIVAFEKIQDDLYKKIERVKKYQLEHKEFIEKVLKELNREFSKILTQIDFKGKIISKLYRKEKRKGLKVISEDPEIIMTPKTKYGLDLLIKEPNDTIFYPLFNEEGNVSIRHSGGKREILMLAFLLSIQRILKRFSSFYTLDEPTPHMDDKNTELFMKILGESENQIILFTPRPIPAEHVDEIISLIDNKIYKIDKKELKKIKISKDTNLNEYFYIRKGEIN